MKRKRWVGTVPALVVACGAGVTAGSYVPYDTIERIVICDIEPAVPRRVAPMFARQNYNVVDDPRTTLRRIATHFAMDPDADGWIERAAAMVRGRPAERACELPADERERLAEVCRAGNRLLGRPVAPKIALGA